jgi:hypothetical protein
MSMQAVMAAPIKYVTFLAGGNDDPKPDSNPFQRRLARCLTCQTILVHWSSPLKAWLDDGGHHHTRHELEFPEEWLPNRQSQP